MNRGRRIIIVAGPNGAGKTTFAREFLPREADCPIFINADLIAAGLSPFRPEAAAVRAGRLLLTEIAAKVERRESFAFETTLSGRGVPENAIRRRFKSGYANFRGLYSQLADAWTLYNNAGATPVLLELEERK